jgi:hypothetical protein
MSWATSAPTAAENSPLSERIAERAEPAFQKCPPREFAGFGDARSGVEACREQCLQHRRPAMALQLEHRFARI